MTVNDQRTGELVGDETNLQDRQTDNACLFYMANEKTRRSSKSADHGIQEYFLRRAVGF